MFLIPILVFIFGLIIGSFLNVVILRMNTGRSIVTGRSACPRCDNTLSWYELIPVFSYLGLRGKCAKCKAHISFQYPIVELITAIVFTILYTTIILPHGFTLISVLMFIFAMKVASVLIIIFVYDIKHLIVPDMMVYLFIIYSLVAIVWNAFMLPGFHVGMALADGVLVALPFFLIWAVSKGRGMGFGDVKLTLGIGWLLGLAGGFSAVIFAFWIGAVVGLLLLGANRRYHLQSQIPFAPFLIIATFIVGVYGITIFSLFNIWM
jgi:leader peptidase (prepilin peptidase)/N-methyltransferase